MVHTQRGSVLIVGGGLIGMASAWYLARDGWRITVIDRGRIGGACSFGNCGLVCPSHVLPLTEPAALRGALKALVTPDGPFRIKPRFDPALWKWLARFALRCNTVDMLDAARAIQPLLISSMMEYEQLIGQEGLQCEWQKKGLLFAYASTGALDSYDETNRILAEAFDEPATKLDAAGACQLEPALKKSVAGAWYYEHDAHLRPDRLVQSWRTRLEEQGVQFVEECELLDLRGAAGSSGAAGAAVSAQTSRGDLSADRFLIATGAWTTRFGQLIGHVVPIEPGKGYSLTLSLPQGAPRIPLIFPEHRVAVTPLESGLRLGSIMEFAGYDESVRPERLQLLRSGAAPYLDLPETLGEPIMEPWFGWRPMTYDSLPIIDRAPRWENVWVAAGHNMLGLSMAPATGRLVSELFADRQPHLDVYPYRLDRLK
jgi:D-amino-acid dehydrogenase